MAAPPAWKRKIALKKRQPGHFEPGNRVSVVVDGHRELGTVQVVLDHKGVLMAHVKLDKSGKVDFFAVHTREIEFVEFAKTEG